MTHDPGEKYRDQVDPAHQLAMDTIGLTRALLDPNRGQYQTLIDAEGRMHSFGGLLDPTLYRDMINSASFAQQIRLCKAAIAFLRETDAVASEVEAGQEKTG